MLAATAQGFFEKWRRRRQGKDQRQRKTFSCPSEEATRAGITCQQVQKKPRWISEKSRSMSRGYLRVTNRGELVSCCCCHYPFVVAPCVMTRCCCFCCCRVGLYYVTPICFRKNNHIRTADWIVTFFYRPVCCCCCCRCALSLEEISDPPRSSPQVSFCFRVFPRHSLLYWMAQ